MDQEHKSTLRRTIISQTWNNNLAKKLIEDVEKANSTPKINSGPSKLQLAIHSEKIRETTLGETFDIEGSEF